MTPIIELKQVSKRYDDLLAVDNISLKVEENKILALLGASGCGKTTTLRLLAGLESPDGGEVWLKRQCVAGQKQWIPPEEREIGMVFQDYALFPHLTVEANIAFPLNKMPRQQRKDRIHEMLSLVGLQNLGKRFPHQLSGGQQQRVALARALAPSPAIVLLDEPFSNLDAALRKTTREDVRKILQQTHTTAIFVTHDQEEALSIADEIAVMRSGRILQHGSPQDVYLRPDSRQVAAFVGEANFIPGVAHGWDVESPLGTLPLAEPAEGQVEVMIRPEMIEIKPDHEGEAVVETIQFLGYDQIVKLCVNGNDPVYLQTRTRMRTDIEIGMRVALTVYGRVRSYA